MVITEIGGTTGDIESQPFLEAIRQVGLEQGRDNCCYIHVVLVPYISGSDEYKSKPAQHSVKELQGMGVNPDIIILRADGSVGGDIRRKISTFCNVKPECVIENLTMPSLYQCPLMLHTNGLDDVVVEKLKLDVPPADLTEWKGVVSVSYTHLMLESDFELIVVNAPLPDEFGHELCSSCLLYTSRCV